MTNFSRRINNIRRDTDTIKSRTVLIKDVDTAVLTHIKNVIKPTIVENGVERIVPVYYANPQIWNSIQKNGFMRDGKTQQILVPVIVFKNTGIAKNTQIPVDKLDGNLRKIIYKKYNPKNRYTIFSVNNNIKPAVDYYSVTIPDYVIITYQLQIWTAFVKHMNPILEKFIYAESSYWGNENYKFRASYENIDTNIETNDGENRAVRSTINMSVYAYILPASYNEQDTMVRKLNPAKVIIKTETVLDDINKIGGQESIPVQFEDIQTQSNSSNES